MPGSHDYESEPLVVAAVLELIGESSQLRNEAPLNFVALRSLAHGVGSGGLSRVEMNALRAPLTALLSGEHKCVLDEADDFIDSDKGILQQLRVVSVADEPKHRMTIKHCAVLRD
jgi:hypothetical protein